MLPAFARTRCAARSRMHVLGLDAGGMKTVCLLADEHGTVLASARGSGANLQVQGELEVEKTLHDLMEQALGGQPFLPDAICLGIAGVDRPDDAAVMRGIMRRIGYKTRTLVVNDALVALVAAVGEDPGIVIVCGTGSICYGKNERGQAARAGGWGYILGDEGSGYWMGRRALTAATRHADARGPATALTELTLAHFDVRSVPELVHAVHARDPRRHRIAGLAEAVQAAALEGDALARQILDDAADELLAAAASVAERLEMRGEVFPFVLAGGVFHGVPLLRDSVLRRLADVAPRCQPQLLTEEPALGAVRLALAEARGGAAIPSYI